ncbi:ubiquinone biosynthesis regulatory protein kinase UbiB [Oxalobacter vibrioformis]|uniref:Ubiquinone biosynthesis regulatory protein kinase UbiB n=1 Tax=Oxalobacter vibrioformis TaxID=933080 RepID=A0A9E9LU09_9BURK|nr:ubiquinone biosynthesis regulatory protein kinase UbiB [Oxalobacter vibrioformis]WAW09141.1 ubiquinone biosynthesis regulatory protein kinase UbiB [Oxalobacter vibrioformis]
MRKFWRLLTIFFVAVRYGLDDVMLSSMGRPRYFVLFRYLFFWRNLSMPRGARLRLALETLGPIFIKLGQALSTRPDLMPEDIIAELSLLQDRVPPFDSDLAVKQITDYLGAPPEVLFAHFDRTPVASASVAQVHFAILHNGTEVAVKVLRPNMQRRVGRDIDLMRSIANWSERLWEDARRLRLRDVIDEFDKSLQDELDLMREAANCSQFKRNFADSPLLIVPEIYWEYCSSGVMVMERVRGIPVSQTDRLVAEGLDLKKLAENGVEIFLTQVFRDGFFHADMHPGNIFISAEMPTYGRYVVIDFGIVGTLNNFDKAYLAENILAFFHHDYRRVAEAHIESGWAPRNTRVEELEAAVRTCCEPIFDKPLKDFSLGQLLMRLFQTSRRFNIEIQPQLVMLQKTMLNIEGLGRQLDPDLDLWKTAKPILEEWMKEQIGFKGMVKQFRQEAVRYGHIFPQLPRLFQQALIKIAEPDAEKDALLKQLVAEQKRTRRLLNGIIYFGCGLMAGLLCLRFFGGWRVLFF